MLRTSFVAAVGSTAAVLALIGNSVRAQEEARARISVQIYNDKDEVVPARAWITVNNKQFFNPASPDTAIVYAKDRSFSCDGEFSMDLPPGNAVLHVERGKECVPVDIEFVAKAGEKVRKSVRMKRWINMPAQGWYSADLHVHLGHDNPQILEQLALADDVHLVPAFTYWLRGRGEEWLSRWPDGMLERPLLIDDHHLITRNNIEIERIDRHAAPGGTVGATFLFNLKRPVTASRYGEHFPTDATLCRVARSHSPNVVFDSDKPSWAETVIGAALGLLDTVQVCHNHYYRTSTGLGGYGMIGPLAAGESNYAVGDGLFHRTNQLYYRFLNCGFRLGVSGGSAIGVKAMPTGHHRVYAKVEGKLTAEKMWKAIREGRSFATTGPMLWLLADGKSMGAIISRSSSNDKPIKLIANVQSIDSLESLQIVHNGRVIASRNLLQQKANPVIQQEMTVEVRPKRSGWVAARTLFRAPDGLLRQAHTSPIYLSVDEKPTAFAEDARYMLRWIDVLDDFARSHPDRFPSDVAQKQVLATYKEARAKYEAIVVAAKQHWAITND